VNWYGTDLQGSVRLVFDNSGIILGSQDYSGFGSLVASSGSGLDRYGYTGREWDNTLSLQYSRARIYDPATGRFLSADPLGFSAGDVNLYRYVSNSPTNASDPSGMFLPFVVSLANLAFVGGGISVGINGIFNRFNGRGFGRIGTAPLLPEPLPERLAGVLQVSSPTPPIGGPCSLLEAEAVWQVIRLID
jgi:RHS repeat-associated protein